MDFGPSHSALAPIRPEAFLNKLSAAKFFQAGIILAV